MRPVSVPPTLERGSYGRNYERSKAATPSLTHTHHATNPSWKQRSSAFASTDLILSLWSLLLFIVAAAFVAAFLAAAARDVVNSAAVKDVLS
ncbi:hypothetical protein BV898_16215 [Hypsibius exemplaris]|uniref:Uncharacterized protein n=1 Tax=Hypsibius exemplaris TaxID=2072580 RepID=A0A9X6ND47_HYPEX|nr:hypothetical protein BV898_16215 [Hypsibius exemplaris]